MVYYEDIVRGDYMEILEIKKGVAMPPPKVVFSYPYEDMEVGDSFVVPVTYRAKVLNANYRASKRTGFKFTSKTEGNVFFVWRTA